MYFYKELPVDASLSPWVQCVWVLYADNNQFNNWSKLLPDNTVEIIFSKHNVKRKHGLKMQDYFNGNSHVASIKTHLQHAHLGSNVDMIGVRLNPISWTLFSDRPPCEHVNSIIDIKKFFGNRIKSTFERILLEEPDLNIRFKTLEMFLLSTINRNKKESLNIVKIATDLIQTEHGSIKITELAKTCACSTKSLNRYFVKHVGLTPKQYSKVIKVRTMLAYKLINQNISSTECAYSLGYYDLTHLHKDVRNLGNLKPSDILNPQNSDTNNIQLFMMQKSFGPNIQPKTTS